MLLSVKVVYMKTLYFFVAFTCLAKSDIENYSDCIIMLINGEDKTKSIWLFSSSQSSMHVIYVLEEILFQFEVLCDKIQTVLTVLQFTIWLEKCFSQVVKFSLAGGRGRGGCWG